jgi:superfamily I DNA/RNA helicase
MPGGNASGLTDDTNMQYFQRKLYKSLKVPLSRLEPETMYSFGRVSEITRDELKFSKFIKRLRARFTAIFTSLLEKQLVLKGILTPEEFKEIKNAIRYDFVQDNYFQELKEAEITRERLSTLREVEEHVGTYYSREWVLRSVLRMSEEEMKDMKDQIQAEAKENPPEEAEE